MLDTFRAVETPEGVELGLRVAGPAPRLLAWAIDQMIRMAAYIGLSIPLALLGNAGVGLYLLVIFLLEWFYPVLFEVQFGGATPGKRALGLTVINVDGTPVDWTASLTRNLLRFADFLPFLYAFGIVSMLVSRDFRRLGDLAAGTLVVHREVESGAFRVPPVAAIAPPVPLAPEEQRAVIEFAERLESWNRQRAAELAGCAAPLTEARGEAAIARLVAMANWLVGRH